MTFIGGAILAGVVFGFLSSSIVSGFLGGIVSGYVFGNYFAKRDLQKLGNIYAELDIPFYRDSSQTVLSLILKSL